MSSLHCRVLFAALALALFSVAVCEAQVCANTTTAVIIPVGSTSNPLDQFQCSSTFYPSSISYTFINNGSTGNLSVIVYNAEIGLGAGNVFTLSPQGPTTNGSITSCAPSTPVNVPVGTTYNLWARCDAVGGSSVGQCNVQYNVQLTCLQARQSSTGISAGSVTSVGAFTWAAALMAAVATVAVL